MLQDTFKHNENVQVNSKEMEALKEHFPQCFDKNGNFDVKIFEELINTKEISIKKEGYALNFLGKSYARYLSNLESETVIVPDESNKDNPSENIYIVGDNLDALQHLKHSYAGAIKCIYIDPPYNTGSDGFVYNDKFEFSAKELADKIGIEEDEAERILNMQGKSTHSAWLTFMYPRLELAKELLADDGAIFISIDNNEQANCKKLCDEIFGENNFIETIIWIKKTAAKGVPPVNMIVNVHEYILVYKGKGTFRFRGIERDIKGFKNPDNDPRGPWRESNIKSTTKTSGEAFTIVDPNSGRQYTNTWAFSRESLDRMIAENRIIWKKALPKQKEFLYEMTNDTQAIKSAWGVFDAQSTTVYLKKLIPEVKFDNPKPLTLMEYLLTVASRNDDLVLDFFSGSGTTAQAVLQRNLNDCGKRKFIMVQIDEPVKNDSEAVASDYNTIDKIGRERIRRAASKIRADEPEKSKDVDLGFKTYYLKTPEKQTLDKMERFNPEFPIDGNDMLSAFGKDTVLATWEIKDGYGFNTPIKEIELKGYKAYLINDGVHGANLYLLDEIAEPSIMELVRQIESNELVVDKIIVFGYALSFTASTSLRTNLKTLKNRNPIDVTIRY